MMRCGNGIARRSGTSRGSGTARRPGCSKTRVGYSGRRALGVLEHPGWRAVPLEHPGRRAVPLRRGVPLALVVALVLAVTFPLAALADEGDGNVVDPTQRADNSFIYDTTIESLFEQASLFDDRTVQVVGEVVGDRIAANDGTGNYWVTLTSTDEDNASSISVLLSAEQAGQIDRFGRYGVTGTTLQVRGTYHQACGEHDGLPDIHATNSSVLAKGIDHSDSFVLGDFIPGLVAVIVGLALMGVFYFARERMR